MNWQQITLHEALLHAKSREIQVETQTYLPNGKKSSLVIFTDNTQLILESNWYDEYDSFDHWVESDKPKFYLNDNLPESE